MDKMAVKNPEYSYINVTPARKYSGRNGIHEEEHLLLSVLTDALAFVGEMRDPERCSFIFSGLIRISSARVLFYFLHFLFFFFQTKITRFAFYFYSERRDKTTVS